MKRFTWVFALLGALWFAAGGALAQTPPSGFTECFSSSLAISATSANVQLPACGPTVVIWNVGSSEVFIATGSNSATVARTTAGHGNQSIPAGTAIVINAGFTPSWLAGITAGSTSTLRVSSGWGFPVFGSEPGSGGGGGGGNSTIVGPLGPNLSSASVSITPATDAVFDVNCSNCGGGGGGGAITGPLGPTTLAAQSIAMVFGSGSTLPAFAATPTFNFGTLNGAATAANQATMIASLASIDLGLPAGLGQAAMVASMPVVLASNQTSIPVTQSGIFTFQGNIASGSANGGNPIKIGGAYNATQPTVGSGSIIDAQFTTHGAQIVATGTDAFNVTCSNCSGGSGANIGVIGATSPTSGGLAGAIATNGPRTLTAGFQYGLPVDTTTDALRMTIVGGQAMTSPPGTAPGGSNASQIQGCGPAPIANCIPVETSNGPNVLVGLTPVVTVGAYTSGMSVGGLQIFPAFRSTAKPSGILTSFTTMGGTTAWNTITLNVYFYTAVPTGGCADHTAFTWNIADLGIMVPGSPFSLAMIAGNVASTPVQATQPFAQSIAASNGTANLYACVITTGTPNPTLGSIRWTVGVIQD